MRRGGLAEPEPRVPQPGGQPPGEQLRRGVRVGEGGGEGVSELLRGGRPGGLSTGRGTAQAELDQCLDDLLALPAQRAQLLGVQVVLCLAQGGPEVDQLLDLRPVLADQQVRQPRTRGGPAQTGQPGRQHGVAVLLGLPHQGVPALHEVRHRGAVQLVRGHGEALVVHGLIVPRGAGGGPADRRAHGPPARNRCACHRHTALPR